MRLPPTVQAGIQASLSAHLGRDADIVAATGVGGGCISASVRLELHDGSAWFAKWNPDADPELFTAEADGLEALRRAAGDEGLRVPEVVGAGGAGGPSDPGWIVMEHVAAGPSGRDYAIALGRGLALLHQGPSHRAEAGYGWRRDNYIGSLPQANDRVGSWTSFWGERRLLPQLRLARDRGTLEGRESRPLDELLENLDPALEGAEDDGPSLLHGDLWGGNVFAASDGSPVLIDPAVYRGHREVDLAMSELFGFPGGFMGAYREAWPVEDAYHALRRDVYQLYYLLVHVNLFGRSYVAPSLGAARRVLAAI